MAKVKPRRGKLKILEEPEEVLNLAQLLLEQLKRHWKWVGLGVLIGLVAFGAWQVNARLQAGREEKASAALAQVRAKLTAPEAETQVLKDLEQFNQEYRGTKAAQEAVLVKAHLLYQTKNYGEAAKAYETLLKGQDPGWEFLVTESLSYCYEGLGDFRKAATTLAPLADKTSGAFQSEVRRRLALLWEQAGDPKEAAALWQKLLEHPPNPAFVPYLKEKLAATEAAAKN